MFRDMRLKEEALCQDDLTAVLERRTAGVLAVYGDAGYPYAVPLTYYYDGQNFFFHGAKTGHKIDALTRNNHASFCVIDRDDVSAEALTNEFRSVIAFGRVEIITDTDRKRAAMMKFAGHLAPGKDAAITAYLDRAVDKITVLKLTVEHMTGKEAGDLVQQKKTLLK